MIRFAIRMHLPEHQCTSLASLSGAGRRAEDHSVVRRHRNAASLLCLFGLVVAGLGCQPMMPPLPPPPPPPPPPPSGPGHIVFRLADGRAMRLEARPGAMLEDLSAALDRLSARRPDVWVNTSPDGSWLLFNTERFDPACDGWACLAVVRGDLSSGDAIRIGGGVIHPEGYGAISSDGNLVVYAAQGGPHTVDLFATRRSGDQWQPPTLLTAASPFAFNAQPSLSADGQRVLFDGGDQPFAAAGTAICEVAADATGFHIVATPAQPPAGLQAGGALHHADYAPDGAIVFEGNWDGERLWRIPPGGGVPVAVPGNFHNDNSPCVLPDGRIVSLWLDRPGASGVHEIKVMMPDGTGAAVLLENTDVADVGVGCSP